ncbi:MAG: hypothetical protein ACM3NS_00435 [Deltaproteobacteria bacterium]
MFAVRLRNCRGQVTTVRVPDANHPIVVLPYALLAQACVLRVGIAGGGRELPLAVAHPTLFSLPVPTPAPDEYHAWHGDFNTDCDADTPPVSPTYSLVAISSDSAIVQSFVLGKKRHVLMQVATLTPRIAPSTGYCLYVVLPGVAPEDVRWGPHDVEGFWLATLARGGGIRDLQFLADMVVEPSGPLDSN